MNIRVDYCAFYACVVDLGDWKPTPQHITYQYVRTLDDLKKMLKEEDRMIWLPRVYEFEKWLKEYEVVADLGYLIFIKQNRIERIVNIHIFYSKWVNRPQIRLVEIAEFISEIEEEDDL